MGRVGKLRGAHTFRTMESMRGYHGIVNKKTTSSFRMVMERKLKKSCSRIYIFFLLISSHIISFKPHPPQHPLPHHIHLSMSLVPPFTPSSQLNPPPLHSNLTQQTPPPPRPTPPQAPTSYTPSAPPPLYKQPGYPYSILPHQLSISSLS